MTTHHTLPPKPPPDSPQNYAHLRSVAMEMLEQLAGDQWTDFNAHDPGITLLEALAYALTDLAYRANFPMADLLAREGEPPPPELFTAAQILTTDPVTPDDWRRLVLDLPGVRNAWIEPRTTSLATGNAVPRRAVEIHGRYRLTYEADPTVSATLSDVEDVVERHRGICQDIEVLPLGREQVTVKADVEIEAVNDVQQVIADVARVLHSYFSPSPVRYAVKQRREAGHAVDEIFDGPTIRRGILDADALASASRREQLRSSDLIRALMALDGVRLVRDLTLNGEAWTYELSDGQVPWPKRDSHIRLMRGNRIVGAVSGKDMLTAPVARVAYATNPGEAPRSSLDLPVAPGRDRNLSDYHSVIHDLPGPYGVAPGGLPSDAPPERRATARQLQAYLLLFDAVMASSTTQLAALRDLFAASDDPTTTHIRLVDEMFVAGLYDGGLAQTTADLHQAANADGEMRRNRLLDHLLSRFAEQFRDYALALDGVTIPAADYELDTPMTAQAIFLRNYDTLSRERMRGFNRLLPLSKDNRGGLERWVAYKLGLGTAFEASAWPGPFFVVEHILLYTGGETSDERLQLAEALAGRRVADGDDPFSNQLTFVFPAALMAHEGFSAFAYHTIYEETPAHLVPYIRSLAPDDYARVAATYAELVQPAPEVEAEV